MSERAQIPEQRRHVLGGNVGEKETPQRRFQVKPDVNFLLLDGGRSISAAGRVRGPPDLVYEARECEHLLLFRLFVGLTAQGALDVRALRRQRPQLGVDRRGTTDALGPSVVKPDLGPVPPMLLLASSFVAVNAHHRSPVVDEHCAEFHTTTLAPTVSGDQPVLIPSVASNTVREIRISRRGPNRAAGIWPASTSLRSSLTPMRSARAASRVVRTAGRCSMSVT